MSVATPVVHVVVDDESFRTAIVLLLNTLLRLYSPLEPFFPKQWRPTEIELVK